MEEKTSVVAPAPVKTQPRSAPPISAFRAIAMDSRVGPKAYVKNFVAPGGGE